MNVAAVADKDVTGAVVRIVRVNLELDIVAGVEVVVVVLVHSQQSIGKGSPHVRFANVSRNVVALVSTSGRCSRYSNRSVSHWLHNIRGRIVRATDAGCVEGGVSVVVQRGPHQYDFRTFRQACKIALERGSVGGTNVAILLRR